MLEAKKYNIIEWIISVADEKVIDAIEMIRDKVELKSEHGVNQGKSFVFSTSTYSEIMKKRVDVEQLKTEQNYKSISPDELHELASQADIKESIDDLLEDLKKMG